MPLPYPRAALIALALLTCGFANPAAQRQREMIDPTVHIDCAKGDGSGTVIYSGKGYTLILTNHHVMEGEDKCVARFFHGSNEAKKPVKVVADDEDADLALLRVDSFTTPAVARLADDDAPLFPAEDVYAAGAGLAHPVFLTQGLLSLVDEEFGDTHSGIMFSAPIAPGNSGGSLWHLAADGHYEMIGVPEAIQSVPITHFLPELRQDFTTFAFAIPMKTVRAFLAAHDFGFVVGE